MAVPQTSVHVVHRAGDLREQPHGVGHGETRSPCLERRHQVATATPRKHGHQLVAALDSLAGAAGALWEASSSRMHAHQVGVRMASCQAQHAQLRVCILGDSFPAACGVPQRQLRVDALESDFLPRALHFCMGDVAEEAVGHASFDGGECVHGVAERALRCTDVLASRQLTTRAHTHTRSSTNGRIWCWNALLVVGGRKVVCASCTK